MSEERHPNNLVAMLFAVVPGLSQVYLEHVLLGAIFFSAFLTALNCLFLASNLQSATNTEILGQVSLLSLIVIWIGSAWHAYALSYGTDRSGLARDRGQLLRMALLDYLKNDLEAAAIKLERAIELDVDWQDPDPLFHLGVVLLRLAEERALDQDMDACRVARRRSQWAFRTCLGRDRFGKWRREIRRETKRMRTLLQRNGRGTSERLDVASDTTLAAFPELGETGALRRSALGPDSSRYPRITPRPFSRQQLQERLAASGLEADTVAALPPGEEGSPGLEAETRPPPQESSEGGDEAPAPADREEEPVAVEASGEDVAVEDAAGSADPQEAQPGLSETQPALSETQPALSETQPAERLLPGEDGKSFARPEGDSAAGAELVTEDGIPATRLDVRPKDLIADLLPATRQRSREERELADGLTPYPPTRQIQRIEDGVSELRMPPTRHVSRDLVGSLRAERRAAKEATEAEAEGPAAAKEDEAKSVTARGGAAGEADSSSGEAEAARENDSSAEDAEEARPGDEGDGSPVDAGPGGEGDPKGEDADEAAEAGEGPIESAVEGQAGEDEGADSRALSVERGLPPTRPMTRVREVPGGFDAVIPRTGGSSDEDSEPGQALTE